eukprot:gene27815-10_t
MASFIRLSEVANQATSTSNMVNDSHPPIKGVRVLSGTSNEPTLAFFNDTDTGIYNVSPNNIGIVTGGVKRVTVDSEGLSVNGTLTVDKDIVASSNISSVNGTFTGNASVSNNFSTNTIRTSTGSSNAPAYSFETDSNTGIFSPGTGFYGITTGGVARLVCDSYGDTEISGDLLVRENLSVNGTLTVDKDIVASSNISSVNGTFSGNASVVDLLASGSGGRVAVGATAEARF